MPHDSNLQGHLKRKKEKKSGWPISDELCLLFLVLILGLLSGATGALALLGSAAFAQSSPCIIHMS